MWHNEGKQDSLLPSDVSNKSFEDVKQRVKEFG